MTETSVSLDEELLEVNGISIKNIDYNLRVQLRYGGKWRASIQAEALFEFVSDGVHYYVGRYSTIPGEKAFYPLIFECRNGMFNILINPLKMQHDVPRKPFFEEEEEKLNKGLKECAIKSANIVYSQGKLPQRTAERICRRLLTI